MKFDPDTRSPEITHDHSRDTVSQPSEVPHRTATQNAVLVGALLLLSWVLVPLWQPLLFAAILAAGLAGVQQWLARRLRGWRYLAAGIATVGVVILIVTPVAILGTMAVRQAMEVILGAREVLEGGGLSKLIRPLPDALERYVRPWLERISRQLQSIPIGTGSAAGRWAALQVQSVLATVVTFSFDLVMMLIALFFLLADGTKLVDWIRRVSPLGRGRTQELLEEFRLVARSLIGSNFITGVVQATVATSGYYLARAPQPLFFGLITLLTSFIPSVGTAIVSVPLALFMLLTGHPWAAFFLAVWGLLVVGTIDNLLRPWLMRSEMHVHGALLFFVIIGGISLFGIAGLVVGPMALTLFMTMLRFYARDLRRARTTQAPGP